jgi:hypothetical protein
MYKKNKNGGVGIFRIVFDCWPCKAEKSKNGADEPRKSSWINSWKIYGKCM